MIRVHEGSPADVAGIVPGDLIAAIDGQPIADLDDLMAALDRAGPGGVVNVALERDGQGHESTVTVGDLPA